MNAFAVRLLAWFERHGRHDLPWQKNRSLYRVWVSEIMLQQTQVATVIPYYRRFMRRFPSLKKLAAAELDEVLQYWAGLGYYSRARNLHRAARQVVAAHGGRFPRDYDRVLGLPGIGPSTAAAILAQALDQPHAILDGNVKRVLCRYHAIEGWPGLRHIEQLLWQKARALTPESRVADYTQAIMDLGATVCARSRPDCEHCPLSTDCQACQQGLQAALPSPRPRKALPVKKRRFFLLHHTGQVLLEKRPPGGIWGGLWSLPEADPDEDVTEVCQRRWAARVSEWSELPAMRHTFSHFHLDITPTLAPCEVLPSQVNDASALQWHALPVTAAVAAPVRLLLDRLAAMQADLAETDLTQAPRAD